MDLNVATQEQIEAFEKGAAARYQERKVPQETAQTLYQRFMGKAAAELGIMSPEQMARVDQYATKIAAALGRERPATPKA